jgi:hypothetical protein
MPVRFGLIASAGGSKVVREGGRDVSGGIARLETRLNRGGHIRLCQTCHLTSFEVMRMPLNCV